MTTAFQVGDRVRMDEGLEGVVVANITAGAYSDRAPAANWDYLDNGLLIDTAEAGLVHYPEPVSLGSGPISW